MKSRPGHGDAPSGGSPAHRAWRSGPRCSTVCAAAEGLSLPALKWCIAMGLSAFGRPAYDEWAPMFAGLKPPSSSDVEP